MKLAFVMADDVDEAAFVVPFRRLLGAGHDVVVVGPDAARGVLAWGARDVIRVELAASRARAAECEARPIAEDRRVVPRHRRAAAIEFVEDIESAGRLVGAIGHSPWVLVEPRVDEAPAAVASPAG